MTNEVLLGSGHLVSVMVGGGFLRGVCNKISVLRRSFKQITKIWKGMKYFYISKFYE